MLHIAPNEPGRYRITALLDSRTERMPKLVGETERCIFKVPKGAVNDIEMIGISISELVSPDEQIEVGDPRYMTAGTQCRISAAAIDGASLVDYRLLTPGVVCMPMPDVFRPMIAETLVGTINSDSTLTALSSKLYLATSSGDLKVCGNLSSLPATTTVALRAEVAGELPPTPMPTPDMAAVDTGARHLSINQIGSLMFVGMVTLMLVGAILITRLQRSKGQRR